MIYKNRLAPLGAIVVALSTLAVVSSSNAQPAPTVTAAVPSLPQWNLAKGHKSTIWGMRFSPDGNTLATASSDHTVRLWDVERGIEQKVFGVEDGDKGSLSSAPFSPDGKTIYAGHSTGAIVPWNIVSGKRGRIVQTSRPADPENHNGDSLGRAELSPDGRTLWTNNSGFISAWNLKSGTRIRSINLADAQSVITSQISVWYPNDSTNEAPRSENTRRSLRLELNGFALSPDGRTLATGVNITRVTSQSSSSSLDQNDDFGNVVCLWEAATGKLRRVLRAGDRGISSIAFSPDGKMLATGGERLVDDTSRVNRLPGEVRVWDVESGQLRHILNDGDGDIRALAFSQDGHLVSGDLTGAVTVWYLATEKVTHQWQEGRISPYGTSEDWINALAFSPRGNTLAITFDGAVRLRQFPSGELLRDLPRAYDASAPIAFSPDGKILYARHGWQSLALWDVKEAALIRIISLSSNPLDYLQRIVLSPDGKSIASTLQRHEGQRYDQYSTVVQLWDVSTGQPRDMKIVVDGTLNALAFSPNSTRLAIGHQFYPPLSEAQGQFPLFQNDRKLIGRVQMWDIQGNVKLWEHDENVGGQGQIAFSPDGSQLAMTCWENSDTGLTEIFSSRRILSQRGNVRIMEAATGATKQSLALQDGLDSFVALFPEAPFKDSHFATYYPKPNGKLSLFTTAGGTLRIWDLQTGALGKPITDIGEGLAISPDGKTIAAIHSGWHSESGDGVVTMSIPARVEIRHTYPIRYIEQVISLPDASGAVFSPDGTTIATTNEIGISVWKIKDGKKLATFATIASPTPSSKDSLLPPWIAFTPNHEYNGSLGVEQFLQELNGGTLSPAKTTGLRQPEKVRQSLALR